MSCLELWLSDTVHGVSACIPPLSQEILRGNRSFTAEWPYSYIYIYVNTRTPYKKYRGVAGAEAHLPEGF